jgi:hypothetical protein
MSIYPIPKTRNGFLNTIFNKNDYIQTISLGGPTQAQNDSRYLKNTGIVVSSAATTFNSKVNIAGLATIDSLVTNSLNTKKNTDSLVSSSFSTTQTYSYNNGMVYFTNSNDAVVTNFSITDIPIDQLKSYIFTFIFEPNTANSKYYIKTSNISINGISTPLIGLANVVLPSNFTYLVQQISLINRSSTTTPAFIAITSVSAY